MRRHSPDAPREAGDRRAAARPVICPYCDRPAELVGGDVIYPHRPDLHHRKFWRCAPCNAWVGTHVNSASHAPLGRLANAELRMAKQAAHAAFDPLWKARAKRSLFPRGPARRWSRRGAYRWLAGRLGMSPRDCHIGLFDAETCRRVVEICNAYRAEQEAGDWTP